MQRQVSLFCLLPGVIAVGSSVASVFPVGAVTAVRGDFYSSRFLGSVEHLSVAQIDAGVMFAGKMIQKIARRGVSDLTDRVKIMIHGVSLGVSRVADGDAGGMLEGVADEAGTVGVAVAVPEFLAVSVSQPAFGVGDGGGAEGFDAVLPGKYGTLRSGVGVLRFIIAQIDGIYITFLSVFPADTAPVSVHRQHRNRFIYCKDRQNFAMAVGFFAQIYFCTVDVGVS